MDSIDDLCALIQKAIGESQAANGEEVRPETELLILGLLDSLTIMRIVTRIEEEAGITIPETSVVAANFRTPAALWDAVQAVSAGAHERAV